MPYKANEHMQRILSMILTNFYMHKKKSFQIDRIRSILKYDTLQLYCHCVHWLKKQPILYSIGLNLNGNNI